MATKATTDTAATATAAAEQKKRTYIITDEAFEKMGGQEYGGQSEVLEVREGECAGPFEYCGSTPITTELGETTSHLAFDTEGEQVRLPIQATFLKALDQARIGIGDTFAIKRYSDATKKKGKGAGKPMAIYSVRVISRAKIAQEQAVAS